jgi:hypothetical protein
MQTTTAAFTAEEKDTVRRVVAHLDVSWKRYNLVSARTFTIGVSTIGGSHIIGLDPGSVGSPGLYQYYDETDYLLSLNYERGLNIPTGGLVKALGEAKLDNTSGRFLPRHMGGRSELFTAMLPRRPLKVSAGFKVDGIDYMIPQFAGILSDTPSVDSSAKQVALRYTDYVDYFQNKYLDRVAMYTGQRSDQILQSLFSNLGMATSQYDLDTGINIIPFAYFDTGSRFSDIINQIVEAENGHFYQDEQGRFVFANRQHWDAAPYNTVQRVITTAQVINSVAPDDSQLINVVEVKSSVRTKRPKELLFTLSSPYQLNTGTNELFVNFDDPVLAVDLPNSYVANTLDDESGTDVSASITIDKITQFAQAAKIIINNTTSSTAFLTKMTVYGRPAKVTTEIYLREKDGSSVTAYDERPFTIENNFIGSSDWALSYARMILNDYSTMGNYQKITMKAHPDLQLGDLVSWQGHYWKVFDIKTTIDPSVGFVQELFIIQRPITTYFRIGISTIGSSDQIAP